MPSSKDDIEDNDIEDGPLGVGRIEAFSDGVIAIIITIMVLDLHAPTAPGLLPLWHLWPTMVAYGLSYAYVAIYWVNHHRMFSLARISTNGLLWSNITLLFALSLVPFSTAYLGAQHISTTATQVYIATLLLPALTYVWLQKTIRKTGSQSRQAQLYHLATTRKGLAGTAIYILGLILAGWYPWAGIACAGLVALAWVLPFSRLNSLFVHDQNVSAQDTDKKCA